MEAWLENLKKRLTTIPRIIFPEGDSQRIIKAAYQAYQANICFPCFVHYEDFILETCAQVGIPTEGWYTVYSLEESKLTLLQHESIKVLNINETALEFLLDEPLFNSVALLNIGEVDGMVAGYNYTTGEVISAGNMFLNKGSVSNLISSYFIMDIPNYSSSQEGLLVFADCAVNIDPTSVELSQIAIDTANSVKTLLGWEPRIAFLSSSTHGSIDHENVDKVLKAVELTKNSVPNLKIVGEVQGDVALDKQVAQKKLATQSEVAGNANILIFPNLDAGNISYKLTGQLAKATAYGPLLQGYSKPLFDLSRGSSELEILGVITIASVFASKACQV